MSATKPLRRILRWVFWTAGLIVLLPLSGIGLINLYIVAANQARLYDSVADVPACDVGLVLGTSPWLSGGRPNLHYVGRIETAARLYHAGKVRHLIVSGDNRKADYNEPVMMRAALVERGVPATDITCDYAGFRTLDSVVRAREIFQLKQCVIVTQRYHNYRAVEIARATGLEAWGFCAPDVPLKDSIMTECREALARVAAILDLYVRHKEPHFLGQPQPIQLSPR